MFPSLHVDEGSEDYEKLLSISSLEKTFNINLYEAEAAVYQNPILLSHFSRILAQLIHNMSTLLDVECFILGGYIVECLGQKLIDYTAALILEKSLHHVNLGIAESLFDISTGMSMMVTDAQMQKFLT